MAVEYPGYGEYDGTPNEDQICTDAILLFDFLTSVLKISSESISVLGRSMGSGPGIHLCSNRHPASLVLISPYTSIKNVSKELLGRFIGNLLIKERFSNIEKIQGVRCPVLFIHGKKDKLVPHAHSEALAKNASQSSCAKLSLHENMEHNHFNMYSEVINPIFDFFKETKFQLDPARYIKKRAIMNFSLIIQQFKKLSLKSKCSQIQAYREFAEDPKGNT